MHLTHICSALNHRHTLGSGYIEIESNDLFVYNYLFR